LRFARHDAQPVRESLRQVPVVVPELSTITVGGAVSGCSIESMSFACGGFHDTCTELEVITATGEVLTCRRDNEHRLVFEMMQNSFGTLGIVSKLAFELVPAKPFVHVEYETYSTLAAYREAIQRRFEARDVDFMDGIIHARDCYVLSVGRFVERAPYTTRYDWMKVYYKSTRSRREDYLLTSDYFFRYDRGVTNVRPKSFVARLLFGKLMTSTRWLELGEKLRWFLKSDKPTVTLDVFVPFSKVEDFVSWYEREIDFFPIWCVPYRRVRDYPWLTDTYWSHVSDPLFLDLAIYGLHQRDGRNLHRMFEQELLAVGGIKSLIAHNYYPEQEFWTIYNKPNYDAVKRITDPDDQFRNLYEKTCKAVMGVSP
jgi:FAD/FMN-containing dehydrogenase